MNQLLSILGFAVFLLAVATMPAESVSAFTSIAEWCRDASNLLLACLFAAWAIVAMLLTGRKL